ncbi:MAG: bifunctional phosphoribosylaminoimidazolecarboxamide formyltransferase/IMP cyclohydrolase [Candidatus Micrarchaeota archaeon]|nr:bifunctional phosphoribosylaminoimidazolecarboxamide formyltransferase/IMP cyclohydrolase [Candidatus Micrarchaeota archaeon]
MKIKTALISVYDKTGIIELAQMLHHYKVEIIATSGTAQMLKKVDIPTIEISKYTKYPEIFGGRVKTIHPKIFGGILLRRDNSEDLKTAKKLKIKPIDLVIVNLYPFEKVISQKDITEEKIIENIDIGGVTLIRAAAKNYKYVTVLVDPEDYKGFMEDFEQNKGKISESKRYKLMIKAFERTSHYDWAISRYFGGEGKEKFPYRMKMIFERAYPLRYGENPHQQAAAYRIVGQRSLFDARIYSGKTMSYNNFLDADSALHLIKEFYDKNAVAIIKHNNPCGVATGKNLQEAYSRALASDPLSAYGGVIAFSKRLDLQTAKIIGNQYLEVILAPGYEPEALEVLKEKPSRRILDITDFFSPPKLGDVTFRHITGGMLYQHEDSIIYDLRTCQIVTKNKPTDEEWRDMYFAMIVAKHTKSNAIVIAKNEQTLGIGAGQMSRIDSTKIAISKAKENKFELKNSVAASDAFLPFPDSVEELGKEGVRCLIQPGGSKRDEEIIEVANSYNMVMVFSGIRHFKH